MVVQSVNRLEKTGALDNKTFQYGGTAMGTKKSKIKKVDGEKQTINTEPNEKEMLRNWLLSYTSQKNSAAKLVTLALMQQGGASIKELQDICKAYAEKQPKPQSWGVKRTSELTSHFRWLRGKSYNVTLDEKTQKYELNI